MGNVKKEITEERMDRRGLLKYAGTGLLVGTLGGVIAAREVKASPALAHAMWIHGTSIQVEYTDRISSIMRRGYHTHVECKPGLANWFHFAIPTPVIVSDRRLKIDSVVLMFKTGSGDVALRSVHVYDGPNRIAAYDYDWAHALKGDHPFERFDVPGQPEVQWGVGISVQVGAGVENMAHWMEFSSAGADFV